MTTPKKPSNPNNSNHSRKPGRTQDSHSDSRPSQGGNWGTKSDNVVRGSAPMDRDARPPVKKK